MVKTEVDLLDFLQDFVHVNLILTTQLLFDDRFELCLLVEDVDLFAELLNDVVEEYLLEPVIRGKLEARNELLSQCLIILQVLVQLQ